jgi:hypothetical protein
MTQSSDFRLGLESEQVRPALDVGPRIQQRCLGSSHTKLAKKWEQRYLKILYKDCLNERSSFVQWSWPCRVALTRL